jgi:arabinan endo-1,5-alpha-L-arabinosidase
VRVEAGEFEHIYDPSVGEDEPWYINDHTFVRDDTGTWHLIGITDTEPATPHVEVHLAHATAPALHGPWTKQPFVLTADASIGETILWAPHVIRHDGRYWMFVCAGGDPKTEFRIHLATSDDCWTWERHPDNPLVLDGFEARDPMVLRVGDRWVMYYTATLDGGHGERSNHIVAATESADLVHWSRRHVVYTDRMKGTGGGPTESPFVVERDGRFYLFIGPDFRKQVDSYRADPKPMAEWGDVPGYRGTTVLVSDDPLSFDAAARVGYLDAHAAEVIVDVDGSTWVSHCGWRQGGVYIAPLRWTP